MHYCSFFFGAAFFGTVFFATGFGALSPMGSGMSGTLLLPPVRPPKNPKKPFNALFTTILLYNRLPM